MIHGFKLLLSISCRRFNNWKFISTIHNNVECYRSKFKEKFLTNSSVSITISISPWHKKILALSHKILSKVYKFSSCKRSCLTLVNIMCPNSSAGIPVPSLSNLHHKFYTSFLFFYQQCKVNKILETYVGLDKASDLLSNHLSVWSSPNNNVISVSNFRIASLASSSSGDKCGMCCLIWRKVVTV